MLDNEENVVLYNAIMMTINVFHKSQVLQCKNVTVRQKSQRNKDHSVTNVTVYQMSQ